MQLKCSSCSVLDSPHYVGIFLNLGSPKLDIVLEMQSQKGQIEGNNKSLDLLAMLLLSHYDWCSLLQGCADDLLSLLNRTSDPFLWRCFPVISTPNLCFYTWLMHFRYRTLCLLLRLQAHFSNLSKSFSPLV